MRLAYNLFTQNPGGELADFRQWTRMTKPKDGAGEMLVCSASDCEGFLEPRPELPGVMEEELKAVVR